MVYNVTIKKMNLATDLYCFWFKKKPTMNNGKSDKKIIDGCAKANSTAMKENMKIDIGLKILKAREIFFLKSL